MAIITENSLEKHLDIELVAEVNKAVNSFGPVHIAIYDLQGQEAYSAKCSHADINTSVANNGKEAFFEWIRTVRSSSEVIETLSSNGDRIAIAPLCMNGICIGVLIGQPGKQLLRNHSFTFLKALLHSYAKLLSASITSKRDIDDLAMGAIQQVRRIILVQDLNSALDVSKRQDEALDGICSCLKEALRMDLLLIIFPSLGFVKVSSDELDYMESRMLVSKLTSRAVNSNKTCIINNLSDDEDICQFDNGFSHAVAALLSVGGNTGSLIVLRNNPKDRFFAGDGFLTEAAARIVSVILNNAGFIEQKKNLYNATILALARLAESRDQNTGHHLHRISAYVHLLASNLVNTEYSMTITEEYKENIFHSSVLHDIGKVGIPDSILFKPGKLTEEEYSIMKKHTTIGGNTLRDAEEFLGESGATFLSMGKIIAFYHHEKWDGSGYPVGLCGEDIPLAARLVSIVDVYDAITSKRCYKQAYSHEKACTIIAEEIGRHFDPIVARTFLKIENKFKMIKEKMEDVKEENHEDDTTRLVSAV